jgi:uncharacterized protein YuzB (UPF0349 family)
MDFQVDIIQYMCYCGISAKRRIIIVNGFAPSKMGTMETRQ